MNSCTIFGWWFLSRCCVYNEHIFISSNFFILQVELLQNFEGSVTNIHPSDSRASKQPTWKLTRLYEGHCTVTLATRVSSRGNHFGGGGGGGGGGGKLQEMGVVLYTFLYNCPKFWGGGGGTSLCPPPPPPLDETLATMYILSTFLLTSAEIKTWGLRIY